MIMLILISISILVVLVSLVFKLSLKIMLYKFYEHDTGSIGEPHLRLKIMSCVIMTLLVLNIGEPHCNELVNLMIMTLVISGLSSNRIVNFMTLAIFGVFQATTPTDYTNVRVDSCDTGKAERWQVRLMLIFSLK